MSHIKNHYHDEIVGLMHNACSCFHVPALKPSIPNLKLNHWVQLELPGMNVKQPLPKGYAEAEEAFLIQEERKAGLI